MNQGPTTGKGPRTAEHIAERSSHAIYGLIIITYALVADREAADDVLASLVLLWGAGFLLIVAHVYSAMVAEVGAEGRWLSLAQRHVLIVDDIPVLTAVVVPSILILGAGFGLLGLDVALDLSIVLSLATLFALGGSQARRSGATSQIQLGIGAVGGVVGTIVIALEVFL